MKITNNVSRKRYYSFLVLPLALSLIPLSVQANCSRDDIDHYLDKGFTPSQITAICEATPAPTSVPVPASAPVVEQTAVSEAPTTSSTHYVAPVQQKVSSGNFLVSVINGYDTVLTEDSLSYTIKKCYDVGAEDIFGFPPEICPEIRYTLNLKGMQIIDTARKYFLFGPPEIVLKGQVRRDILTDLKDIKPEHKESLHNQINIGDEVVLPIQQGTPMERVQTELHKILM